MAYSRDRARQYYNQAKEAYNPANSGLFNNHFSVPTEYLFNEVCKLAIVDREYKYRFSFRQIFDRRLTKLIDEGKDYDELYLSKQIKDLITNQSRSRYFVYFGVPIKRFSSEQLPFGKTFKLDDITFTHIGEERFKQLHKGECLNDYDEKLHSHLKPKQSLTWVTKDFYYFKASLEAEDVREAANLTANTFTTLEVCATVAQNNHHYTHSMFNAETNSRSVLTPSGVMLISDEKHKKCDIMWSANIRTEAKQKLDFMSKDNRKHSYEFFKRTCKEDYPISKRLKSFLFEYANALKTDDPHIRQLGLWRCLEIATSKQGSSRPEKDIVQILANYYSKSTHWRQQGDAIKDIRNGFVHSGITLEADVWGSVDKYLNWTQEYVDTALNILRWMRKNGIGKKTVNEIDDFFDLYSQNDATLKMAGVLLRGRKKSRSKSANN